MTRFGKISILTEELPDPTKSSGELRFWQIIEFFRARANTVMVFTPQKRRLPIHDRLNILDMSELDEQVCGSDLAFLEFWYWGDYIPRLRELGVPVIVDAVDVEFRRRDQEAVLLGAQPDYGDNERRREIEAYSSADLVFAVSKQDQAALAGIARRTELVPNIYKPVENTPAHEDRKGVIFVGSYQHQPNSDGIRWYRDHILPRVADLEHIFIGNNADPDIMDIPGFIGGVHSSTDHVSRARVSIAPIRYGAGLKGKTLEAFACATPVVATPVAIEGYTGSEDYPFVTSSPAEFADMVWLLYQDDDLWHTTSAQCREMARRYEPNVVFDSLNRSLEEISGGLD